LQDDKHPNLHVTETKVERVIFDDQKRAVGLVVLLNKDYWPTNGFSEQPHTSITAKRFVVVVAGALGTPQILERSGIGQREHLTRLQIPVVANAPGVWGNYQDHHLCLLPYKTSLAPEETNDALLSGRIDFMKAVKEKNPILGWNSIDLSSKIRPSDAEVEYLGPEFQAA
jgi:alcohol oxidase